MPFAALKKLSAIGVECRFYGVSISESEPIEFDISGVATTLVTAREGVEREILKFSPDVTIFNASPLVAGTIYGQLTQKSRCIQRMPCETAQMLYTQCIEHYNRCSCVVTQFEYEANILRANGVKSLIVSIHNAINTGLVSKSFRKDREYDICISARHGFKGHEFSKQVIDILSVKGWRVHPAGNLNGLSHADFLTELSKCRSIFAPYLSEGCNRTLIESLQLGVLPIIAADSQSVCRQLVGLPHIAVRTWGWINLEKALCSFGADPKEVADDIICQMESLNWSPSTECPKLPDEWDADTQVGKWIDLITDELSKTC